MEDSSKYTYNYNMQLENIYVKIKMEKYTLLKTMKNTKQK